MTDKTANPLAAASQSPEDPLAVFASTAEETDGIWVGVENPNTGEVLMKWKLARFGGPNNPAIIKTERALKAKLTQGQRRAIDAGAGDPTIVQRINRQIFVRVSCLDWEMVNSKLKERYGSFSQETADQILEAYPRMYDSLSEQAMAEENYAADQLSDLVGN